MLNIVLKPHRRYLKANTAEVQKLFVLMKIIPEQQVVQTRPPVALALVIDTSASMRDRVGDTIKIERAIEAAHNLVDDRDLDERVKITLIQFDDDSKVLLPLTPLQRDKVHRIIDTLANYSGGTKMAKGMRNALEQLSKEPTETAKRLILLTDGETFDEDDCRTLATHLAETNTPTVGIGIGDTYNQELLMELADLTKGRQLHLQNMQQLDQFFDEEVRQVVREVVTDLQMKVAAVKGVSLDGISRVYPNLVGVPPTAQPYRLGNIPAGDYTAFILEFTVSGIARPPSRARLAQITLWASAPSIQQRQVEFPLEEIHITFTDNPSATAQVEPEVLHYVEQRNVEAQVRRATQLLAQGKTEEARQTLIEAHKRTLGLNNVRTAGILQDALDEMRRNGTLSRDTVRLVLSKSRTDTIRPDS